MMKNEKEIKYIDLFGGVGGFRLGIERASALSTSTWNESRGNEEDSRSIKSISVAPQQFTCVFYSDIDKYSVQTYNKNFKENYEATDIRTIEADSIPDFDMLCGGFPCQAFSIAGKRRGFKDTRGTLFFEIARIIKAKRPKIVFLENVKGLLNHEKGKTFSVIIQTLSELGYDVQWMVLNSKFFGVPQNRERVFIIGSLRGTSRPEILPFGSNDQEIIKEGTIVRTFTAGGHSGGLHSNSTGIVQKMHYEKLGKVYCNGDVAQAHRVYSPEGIVSSQRGSTQTRIRDGVKIRRLTPIECERLQGFPDNWTEGCSDTQRYKQMGNAVTVNVIQTIAENLL